jgi:hypothetical protein
MVCDTELSTAISCVTGDAATCGSCIDLATYADEFPKNAENAFRSTLAFKPPTDPEICLEANYRTCKPWAPIKDGAHSCCCLAEQEAYIGCQFDTTWLTKYSISDSSCEWYGCDRVMGGQPENAGAASGGGGDSGGFLSSTMIIIIGSSCGGLLLLLLCIFLFCRSRRQRILVAAAAASKLDDENKDKSSTSKGSGKDKKGKDKKKDKKKGKKVRYSMDRIICVIFSKRLDTARHATSSARS